MLLREAYCSEAMRKKLYTREFKFQPVTRICHHLFLIHIMLDFFLSALSIALLIDAKKIFLNIYPLLAF